MADHTISEQFPDAYRIARDAAVKGGLTGRRADAAAEAVVISILSSLQSPPLDLNGFAVHLMATVIEYEKRIAEQPVPQN